MESGSVHPPERTADLTPPVEHAYLVRLNTAARRTVFSCLFCGSVVASELGRVEEGRHAKTLAWSVMPDRLLWLVASPADRALDSLLGALKLRTTHRINEARGYAIEVWEPGFRQERLTDAHAIAAAMRRIGEAAVCAGIVRRSEDYPLFFRANPSAVMPYLSSRS